jgi:hypothetical protein
MEHIQRPHRTHHHDPLQDKKQRLIRHQRATPPLRHLNHPIHAPNHDERRTQRQRAQEAAELTAGPQLRVSGVEAALAPHHAQRVLGAQEHEERQCEHLEGQARDHDVCAEGGGLAVLRGDGGDAAAGGLKDEGDEIAADEEPGVGFRRDAGDVGAEDDDSGVGG